MNWLQDVDSSQPNDVFPEFISLKYTILIPTPDLVLST